MNSVRKMNYLMKELGKLGSYMKKISSRIKDGYEIKGNYEGTQRKHREGGLCKYSIIPRNHRRKHVI